ncbi:MAG: hypothetical protein IPQ10_08835 [Saprospiraceae bacterium]|nr:hypothetical protein [Saprospiraceae bacterium]
MERIHLCDYYGFNYRGSTVNNGDFYNISIKQTLARNTVADPLFPRSGSRFSVSVQLTPPYHFLDNPGILRKVLSMKDLDGQTTTKAR